MIDIREVMTDPALFGEQFGGESWQAWRALLAGFYGLRLDPGELKHWKYLTGRIHPPSWAHEELWLVIGRRGGKSQVAALTAVYEAAFKDYSALLAPGEVATVMVLAADKKQARTVFRYISGLVDSNPMLRNMVEREDREAIHLNNGAAIEVHTANFRNVRGYTVACCIADEIAFWRSEDSANPDFEILNAVRPAMATLDGKLLALSSPYAKRGELWENYRRYFGQAGPVLVAQADSRTMNPTLPQRVIDRAFERDAASASAEYMAQFRTDLESFLTREVVESAIRPDPLEIPFDRRNKYFAFVDPAGGGQDEFTLAIGHTEGNRTIVDLVRARRGVPANIVEEFAEVLKSYNVHQATSDRYAGSWPADEFHRHGIRIEHSPKPKSDLYLDALAALNSGRAELPPDDKLQNQLLSLERRTSRAGKDSVDHPPRRLRRPSQCSGGHCGATATLFHGLRVLIVNQQTLRRIRHDRNKLF